MKVAGTDLPLMYLHVPACYLAMKFYYNGKPLSGGNFTTGNELKVQKVFLFTFYYFKLQSGTIAFHIARLTCYFEIRKSLNLF